MQPEWENLRVFFRLLYVLLHGKKLNLEIPKNAFYFPKAGIIVKQHFFLVASWCKIIWKTFLGSKIFILPNANQSNHLITCSILITSLKNLLTSSQVCDVSLLYTSTKFQIWRTSKSWVERGMYNNV